MAASISTSSARRSSTCGVFLVLSFTYDPLFFLSAPKAFAQRCFFGSVPRQCRKDTTTRLYYTHNPRLCPENLRFYHFPLFFPVFACRSTARTSSQSPSGSAASKNTMTVTVPPAVSTASCPANSCAGKLVSARRTPRPAAPAAAAASSGAPSQRRKACPVPLESSSRPVLAAQV